MCKFCPDRLISNTYPVTFHGLKHHVQCCRHFISTKQTVLQVKQALKTLGNSQMDFYKGNLSPHKIIEEVAEHLKSLNAFSHEAFTHWLKPDNYQNITMSDHSQWTILLNPETHNYIHIHPARHSLYTIRVRATSLKTVLGCKIFLGPLKAFTIDNINVIRKQYLSLSPISSKQESVLHQLNKLI